MRHSLEALVQQTERAVAGAVVSLGGEEDLATAITQGRAVIVETAGIGRRRVTVGHPLVERAVNDGDRLGHAAVSAENPFAPQRELRHLAARAAQRTSRNRRIGSLTGLGVGCGRHCGRCHGESSPKRVDQANCISTIEQSSTNSSRP